MIKTIGLLVSMACLGIVMVGGGASGTANAAEPLTKKEGKTKTAVEIKESVPEKYFDAKGRLWYQLVNITIPKNSYLRDLEHIDKPPQLKVAVKRNGALLGETTHHTGWTVDLPGKLKNQFPIYIGTNDRYTLEVWDDDNEFLLNFDEHILNISQVKGEEFEDLIIYEKSDLLLSTKSLLLRLTWKRILPPGKYRAKTKTAK